MASQLHNDASGIWSDRAHTDSDLLKSQFTYPLLYLLDGDHDPALKNEFRILWAEEPQQRNIVRLHEIIDAVPVRRFISLLLVAYRKEAQQSIEPLSPETQDQLLSWFDEAFLRPL